MPVIALAAIARTHQVINWTSEIVVSTTITPRSIRIPRNHTVSEAIASRARPAAIEK